MNWQKLTSLHYRDIFLFGAYLTIIVAALFATISDYLIGNRVDVIIDGVYGVLALFGLWYGWRTRSIIVPATLLFWLAAAIEFVFLYVHRVDFDLIFALFIPLIAFITLPTRQIVINLVLFFVLLFGILVYYYHADPHHPFLHNSKYMIGYILAHFFMVSFGFFYHFAIENSVKRLEASNRQKTLLLREVHHRVKNNLNFIASLLGLQLRSDLDPKAREIIEQNQHRIESIALLHNILYRHDTLDRIDIRRYLQILSRGIIDSGTDTDRVDLTLDVVPARFGIDTMMQLGILINELITNSLKHASGPDGTVHIILRLRQHANGYRIRYCDGGAVEPEQLQSGFGYRLITMTVRQLNGEMGIDTREGLCYTIDFPAGRTHDG